MDHLLNYGTIVKKYNLGDRSLLTTPKTENWPETDPWGLRPFLKFNKVLYIL